MGVKMYLIFDFDGTLVDSFQFAMQKACLLAETFNCKKINEQDIEQLRELSAQEIIKYLEIPIYRIPQLIFEMRKHFHNEIGKLSPVTNMIEVVNQLFAAKFPLGIATSNSVENVTVWLEQYAIQHYFNFIHSESFHLSKKDLLKKTLEQNNIEPSQAIYICDEARDLEAAKENKIMSIAVTWGYNSEKILQRYEPSFLAKKPEDIIAICSGLRAI